MENLKNLLVEWRHQIHSHPETAFEEVETAKFVAERLREFGCEVWSGIGKTGVVGRISRGKGKTIGLRADMDANEIIEKNDILHKSKCNGKMHACGHDGHVTQLLGAAKIISARNDFSGTVQFVFQPAEEPGKGAAAMMSDGLLEKFPMDEFYGLHNMPNLKSGTVHVRQGGIMASEDDFEIRLHGKGGHASSPHLGFDPLVTASQVILALQTIASRNANPLHPVVVSCSEIHTDGAHNAIPSNVTVTGDTRSTSSADQNLIEKRMRQIVKSVCEAAECGWEFSYTHEFSPTVNWSDCATAVAEAAEKIVGKANVNPNCEPWMASEDFGNFLAKIPGCFFFLGSAKNNDDLSANIPLHNALFDYNDKILETGAKVLAEIALSRLAK